NKSSLVWAIVCSLLLSCVLPLVLPTTVEAKPRKNGALAKTETCDQDDEKSDDDDKASADKDNKDSKDSKDKKKSKDKDEDEPKLSVTEHTITIDGKPVKYKATAGYMVLKEYGPKAGKDEHGDKDKSDKDKDKDKKKDSRPLAKVFFIAYT